MNNQWKIILKSSVSLKKYSSICIATEPLCVCLYAHKIIFVTWFSSFGGKLSTYKRDSVMYNH